MISTLGLPVFAITINNVIKVFISSCTTAINEMDEIRAYQDDTLGLAGLLIGALSSAMNSLS